MSAITDEILSLERRLWTEADRPETMRDIVADGGISVIEPMGAIEKADAVAMPYRGSIASTYARIDGRWRLVLTAHQPWPEKS